MVARQYDEIKKRVEAACLRVGRKPEEVTLIAVSKTKPVEMLPGKLTKLEPETLERIRYRRF